MAETRPPLSRLPTLTEVVMEGHAPAPPAQQASDGIAAAPAAAGVPEIDEARIVEAVMAGLQARIDLMVEYRLREALAPVLARAADTIVHDAREQLAHTLRDVAVRAVSQELARRRSSR